MARPEARPRYAAESLWRLSCVTQGPIPGFAHLEPRRHIPFITELDGPEATTLGTVLARVTCALREAADAEKVYVYVFGDHVLDKLRVLRAARERGLNLLAPAQTVGTWCAAGQADSGPRSASDDGHP